MDDFRLSIQKILSCYDNIDSILDNFRPVLADLLITSTDFDNIIAYLGQNLNIYSNHIDIFRYISNTLIENNNLASKVLLNKYNQHIEFLKEYRNDIDELILHNGDVTNE